ncbi:MAG: Plug domain-containing protein, partial [Nitrospinota bacterium]|nr:Plug domain-containing protein [Nitrospinota bacterium]
MRRLIMILLLQGLLFNTYSPSLALAADDEDLKGEITVTGAREEQKKADTPATVDMINKKQIKDIKPSHPSEIVNRVPGVWVNVTGGEGHMTSIRQPLTTAPVYLYLEDGIPIRSTGFFNHNALYEVNIPMADGLEVTKGPGTSLYGSDSIGGIINSLTKPAP